MKNKILIMFLCCFAFGVEDTRAQSAQAKLAARLKRIEDASARQEGVVVPQTVRVAAPRVAADRGEGRGKKILIAGVFGALLFTGGYYAAPYVSSLWRPESHLPDRYQCPTCFAYDSCEPEIPMCPKPWVQLKIEEVKAALSEVEEHTNRLNGVDTEKLWNLGQDAMVPLERLSAEREAFIKAAKLYAVNVPDEKGWFDYLFGWIGDIFKHLFGSNENVRVDRGTGDTVAVYMDSSLLFEGTTAELRALFKKKQLEFGGDKEDWSKKLEALGALYDDNGAVPSLDDMKGWHVSLAQTKEALTGIEKKLREWNIPDQITLDELDDRVGTLDRLFSRIPQDLGALEISLRERDRKRQDLIQELEGYRAKFLTSETKAEKQ